VSRGVLWRANERGQDLGEGPGQFADAARPCERRQGPHPLDQRCVLVPQPPSRTHLTSFQRRRTGTRSTALKSSVSSRRRSLGTPSQRLPSTCTASAPTPSSFSRCWLRCPTMRTAQRSRRRSGSKRVSFQCLSLVPAPRLVPSPFCPQLRSTDVRWHRPQSVARLRQFRLFSVGRPARRYTQCEDRTIASTDSPRFAGLIKDFRIGPNSPI
jgi:hypothetical protein